MTLCPVVVVLFRPFSHVSGRLHQLLVCSHNDWFALDKRLFQSKLLEGVWPRKLNFTICWSHDPNTVCMSSIPLLFIFYLYSLSCILNSSVDLFCFYFCLFQLKRVSSSWSVFVLKKNCETAFPTGSNTILINVSIQTGYAVSYLEIFLESKIQSDLSRCVHVQSR